MTNLDENGMDGNGWMDEKFQIIDENQHVDEKWFKKRSLLCDKFGLVLNLYTFLKVKFKKLPPKNEK